MASRPYLSIVIPVFNEAANVAELHQQLTASVPRATVAAEILSSSEGRDVLVQRFYLRFLRRGADPGGEAGWAGVLQHGGRDEQVIAGLVGSDEYFARL